ncbi:MAG: ABC transporter [Acidobacteria bacterium]|nr:MAG: ABC transporter [Acidobacteriota bacterium]
MAANLDAVLRQELIVALRGGNAHVSFEEVVADFPAHLRAEKAGLPYSAWQLLEHIRIAQNDILRFSKYEDGKYKELNFPDDYWPKDSAPPSALAWNRSVASVLSDRDEMVQLLVDQRYSLTDAFPWGDGQNLIREAILIVDHTSYHVGELLTLRRMLGIWPAG